MLSGKLFLEGQLIIGVDFDGTITQQPNMGESMTIQPWAQHVLRGWKNQGVRLVLWTCRTGEGLADALEFLKRHDLIDVFDEVNKQLPEIEAKYAPNTSRKLGADIYIDDRNLGCTIDWLLFDKQLRNTIIQVIEGRI